MMGGGVRWRAKEGDEVGPLWGGVIGDGVEGIKGGGDKRDVVEAMLDASLGLERPAPLFQGGVSTTDVVGKKGLQAKGA